MSDGGANSTQTDEGALIRFAVVHDEAGWPPVTAEDIWSRPDDDGHFELLVIPVFAHGVSCHDIVSAKLRPDGLIEFVAVVTPSGHSTLRIIAADPEKSADLADLVRRRGCTVDMTWIPALLAVDVPAQVDFEAMKAWLDELEAEQVLDYEEANLAEAHLT